MAGGGEDSTKALLTPSTCKELEGWVEQLYECKQLSENQVCGEMILDVWD